MRMIDQTLELDCAKQPVSVSARLAGILAPLAALFRGYRNRRAINGLTELDDYQLRDIGLTRADLNSALLNATFFEDPSSQLARTARQRSRLTLAPCCLD